MALQLILGSSGAGKSYEMHNRIITESMERPDGRFIVIVPEQYTMETQKNFVSLHPRKGIMNIDILSFQRLAYRIFGEVGGGDTPVLDDMGKNLIIRKVMENKKNDLYIFQNDISKFGFVTEIKSVISELLQYAVSPDKIKELEGNLGDNRLLDGKLKDIEIVYRAFMEYIDENYITAEEILDVLCEIVEQSAILKGSVIAIDGFTGFTPIQYKLIGRLLGSAKNVMIALTIDNQQKLNVHDGMHNIFFMSKETIYKLEQTALEQGVPIDEPLRMKNGKNSRFHNTGELQFLEENLFRYSRKHYMDETDAMQIYEALNPKEELECIAGQIIKLTRQGGYRYRDIAVITGDMQRYGDMAERIFGQNHIPCFIDNKRSVIGNPFVEYIRSVLEIIQMNFSYESIFRYLRTGLTDVTRAEVDQIENYCLAMGIRGFKRWNEIWIRNYRNSRSEKADLESLNTIRKKVIEPLIPLYEAFKEKDRTVLSLTTALYEFIAAGRIQYRMEQYVSYFEQQDDKSRCGEYKQVYGKVMELFDKITGLLGEEKVSLTEYAELLDAGFEEIKVGLIPPSADSVVVGDIERTRVDNIKVLFFAGVNDGVVPKKAESRGVLSEFDRESLENLDIKLAPSTREKTFIQKFYLYLIMTKPSEKLYLSFARTDMEGKGMAPSYLIYTIRKMYPKIKIYRSENLKEVFDYIQVPKSELEWTQDNCRKAISEATAMKLYGENIVGSVTRIEEFAACEFAHFLNYGLCLSEREEYEIAVRDIGTILHAVLESISTSLKKEGRSFQGLEDSYRRQIVTDTVERVTQDYGNTILKDSKRNEYMIKRLTELADRTVWAIGRQLEHGKFEPELFEVPFERQVRAGEDSQNPEDKTDIMLHGKIDRIDIYEDEENVYVKIVDYKSGNSDFDLLKTYYGLKLQLMAYMKAAMELEGKRHKNKKIVPAGVLYYNINNPIVEKQDEDEQNTEERILEQLRTKGLVNSDPHIVRLFDEAGGKSKVVPVKFSKNGEIENTRNTISSIQFRGLDDFVAEKMAEMSENIIKGKVNLNPYRDGKAESCTYCQYNAICGFYEDMPGMNYRKLKKISDQEIWSRIIGKEEKEDGSKLDKGTKESN